MSNEDANPEQAVRRVVQEINAAWLARRYTDIGALLDEDVVIAPADTVRVRGREAYVQSYRDYDRAAVTHEFVPADPRVDVIGGVAVAVCPFYVVYELEGTTYRERGFDTLVLHRSAGAWRVVWRTMRSEPADAAHGS